MATKIQDRADLHALRLRLETARSDADGTRTLLIQATDRFLTAAEYQDDALMRSALEEAKAALASGAAEKVDEFLSESSAARASIQAFVNDFEGVPLSLDQQLDDLGHSVSDCVSGWLSRLSDFRDGPLAMAGRHGIEVANAVSLDEHVAHWQGLKTNLVDCWPWTDAPLPPVDREMVARSRAAIEAGDWGEDIDALVARLRSE